MPSENGRARTRNPLSIEEMSRTLRPSMAVIDEQFSYFLEEPVAAEDLHDYLQDPITALPSVVRTILPPVAIVLAPYLERHTPRAHTTVVREKPTEARLVLSASVDVESSATLFFTIREEQVSDYHYYFFEELSGLLGRRWPENVQSAYHGLLREELSAEVHGEVDDRSWRAKQALLRRPMASRKDGKPFREYALRSFEDTMTLYLHGICCDIDVEAGPRQLPSRHLRKRLEVLRGLFPPPEGHAVFPEELGHHHHVH
jgi:hypothetical protein